LTTARLIDTPMTRAAQRGLPVPHILLAVLFTIVICVPALAAMDTDDYRKPTQVEIEFDWLVTTTIDAAIPPRPNGWDVYAQTKPTQREWVPTGTGLQPFEVNYAVEWRDTQRKKKADAEMSLALLKATTKEMQREIRREMSPRDWNVTVEVRVNWFERWLDESAVELPSIGGARVFQKPAKIDAYSGDWVEARTYVFMGDGWRLDGRKMSSAKRDDIPHTTAQTILIEVWADAERTRGILQSIDLNALNSLLSRAPVAAGVVGDPVRSVTQQEQDFYRRATATIEVALPPGPAGWSLARQTAGKPPEPLAKGSDTQPLSLDYSVEWHDTERRRKADEEIAQALMSVAGPSDLSQTAIPTIPGDLMKRLDELTAEIMKAVAANDMAKMQALTEEASRLSQQMEAGNHTVGDPAQPAEDAERRIRRELSPRDWKATVDIVVNGFRMDLVCPLNELPLPPIAGARVLQEEGMYGEDGTWEEGSTYVFMGDGWRLDEHGPAEDRMIMQFAERGDVPRTTVQAIIIRVEAEADRAQSILRSIDWNMLNSLLRR